MNEAHVELALGYLRVLLSTPPMTVLGVLVLVWVFRSDLKAIMSRSRIATIKFPGGELSTTSQVIDNTEKTGPEEPPPDLPEGHISLEQQELVRSFIQAQQDTIRLWEYRYLRDYLVLSTHGVLAWLNLQNSTSIGLFNAYWWSVIPIAKSRENTILALQNHYLITVRDVMIEITDKGRDYLQWRGPLPYIPSPKSS